MEKGRGSRKELTRGRSDCAKGYDRQCCIGRKMLLARVHFRVRKVVSQALRADESPFVQVSTSVILTGVGELQWPHVANHRAESCPLSGGAGTNCRFVVEGTPSTSRDVIEFAPQAGKLGPEAEASSKAWRVSYRIAMPIRSAAMASRHCVDSICAQSSRRSDHLVQ